MDAASGLGCVESLVCGDCGAFRMDSVASFEAPAPFGGEAEAVCDGSGCATVSEPQFKDALAVKASERWSD